MTGRDAIAVHDTGDGPALLMLHACPLDGSQWDHQVAALSGDHRCLRPDVWGCGASGPPPEGAATIEDVATALVQVLNERGVQRVTLVGLSMGGYIAFALYRLIAERIDAMVLCNTRATADADDTRRDRHASADRALRENDVSFLIESNVQRLLAETARREVHITDPLRGRILRWTPHGVAFALRAMASRPDSTSLLSSIACPVLVIAGSQDAVIPAAHVDQLVSGIPRCERVTMNCGHLSNLEQPAEFNEHLQAFLRRSAGRTAA